MSGNSNLHMSRSDKAYEFYTHLCLIESELKHYIIGYTLSERLFLEIMITPLKVKFFKYFAMNFNSLGLKKLIVTCYASSSIVYTT